jgi:hypothetical protein
MDSGVVTQSLLLLLCGMVLGAFLAYSVTIIYRLGFTTYLKIISEMGKAIAGLLTKFSASLISLLAVSARTDSASDKSDVAPSGGILNYRTGKLDDGTDPVGWYEKD